MLIRAGTVVSASPLSLPLAGSATQLSLSLAGRAREGVRIADVLIRNGRVVDVRPDIPPQGEEVIDATGMLVLPGLVDPHTHFVLDTGAARTVDDFLSGSASAAAGGVTTYMDFATQDRGQDFRQALATRRRLIDGRSYVDYAVHLNITNLVEGWEGDLQRLVEDGVTSAKIYTTYRETIRYVDDWTWYRLMEQSGKAGFLVQVHAENDAILEGKKQELLKAGKASLAYHAVSRPALAEAEAVGRGLTFSRATGSPIYFVHLSNPLSVDLIAEARGRGPAAIAETCPHFLVLDDSVYARNDAKRYVMTPPLRSKEMQAELWNRLALRLIHTVGSDHCGYSLAQREGIEDFSRVSPGIPGVETSLPLLYSFGVRRNRIALPDLVRLLCANPAKVFGLWPRKGDLAPGFDGDAVIFDPRPERVLAAEELHSRAGYSPYEGLVVTGKVKATICRGEIIYQDGKVLGKPDFGQYLKCQPFDRTLDLV